MDLIVELRNVAKRYSGRTIIENFSLGVKRGEFLTLLGPSGSGKTTILRLIAGFEQPDGGQIFLEGREAAPLPPYRRKVNTVFQHYALFPHLNVFRNVAFGLEERRLRSAEIRRKVQAILELVALPGTEERLPNQLSGGERQRVALARALVLEPSVLLLDEPLGAVDEKLRKQMQIELKRLRQRLGITFIFVTHDQEEALVMSDRVVVLQAGQLEQIGTSEEIYERPRTKFVAEFMGFENFLEAVPLGQEGGMCRFKAATGEVLWAPSATESGPASPQVLSVRPERLQISTGPPAEEARNLIRGVIVESFYEGRTRRSVVETGSGVRLVVREPNANNRDSAADRAPGVRVWVFWEPVWTRVYGNSSSHASPVPLIRSDFVVG
jgi:spermidine/putrescine transport system ATP-binding protein